VTHEQLLLPQIATMHWQLVELNRGAAAQKRAAALFVGW
jgi:hypothetical protein